MPLEPGPDATREERFAYKLDMEAWQRWQDPRPYAQAGADRNMMRHAQEDGLRIVAWLAKYVARGSDPLKAVVALAIDAGWDVDPT